MSIVEVLALLTFGLSCFLAGYKIGKDITKTQKISRLTLDKFSD